MIKKSCTDSGKIVITAGHFMFWPEENDVGSLVHTQNDLDTFIHILYLNVPAKVAAQRRRTDLRRSRPSASILYLQQWQRAEKIQLGHLCRRHGILFMLVLTPTLLDTVSTLLRDFCIHTERHSQLVVEIMMDKVIVDFYGHLEMVLALDADRTLAAEDTGTLFWKKLLGSQGLEY